MEYDNDRIVKGTYKTELYCWLIFVLINPLVNSLGVFPYQKTVWILLLVIALLSGPLYILYSRLIVIKFLFNRKYLVYGVLTVLFFLLVHSLLFLLYKIAESFIHGAGHGYFTYSVISIARESGWICINICFAISISYLRLNLDEKDKMESLQTENTF